MMRFRFQFKNSPEDATQIIRVENIHFTSISHRVFGY